MNKLSLNFYCDPGHGWVKISIDKLKQLGIADKISRYSYMRKNYAYLEEDCDLSTLYAAADKAGIEIRLKEYHTNKTSKIRSYDNYKNPDTVEGFMQYLKDNGKIEFITIGG
jgi:hypothetical protein